MNISNLSVTYNQSIVQNRNCAINVQKKNVNFGDAKTDAMNKILKTAESNSFKEEAVWAAGMVAGTIAAIQNLGRPNKNTIKATVAEKFPDNKKMTELSNDEVKELISICYPNNKFAQKFLISANNIVRSEKTTQKNTVKDATEMLLSDDTNNMLLNAQREFQQEAKRLHMNDDNLIELWTKKPSEIKIQDLKGILPAEISYVPQDITIKDMMTGIGYDIPDKCSLDCENDEDVIEKIYSQDKVLLQKIKDCYSTEYQPEFKFFPGVNGANGTNENTGIAGKGKKRFTLPEEYKYDFVSVDKYVKIGNDTVHIIYEGDSCDIDDEGRMLKKVKQCIPSAKKENLWLNQERRKCVLA